MMNTITKNIAVTLATGGLLLSSFASSALATNDHNTKQYNESQKFKAFMTGEQEVPGPGDQDGKGFAKVKVYPDAGKLCVHMRVVKIDPATAAHIHEAPKRVAGPVVINLPTPDGEGRVHECIEADSNVLQEIKDNPANYYVNVHNNPYPNGAVRGQLQ